MTDYQILFSKKAKKYLEYLAAQQKAKLQEILLQFIATNPYAGKQLKGQLTGFYSYRLTRKDRIVYEIIEDDKVVFVMRVAKTKIE
ncbi:MAG: type II toxin-antitoxin system mRNA interferase toxin, RelE/StbE family [Hormoscilla sp. GM102CHS1]|nr:type II toxin-antitoxin system mRNA interferase toxin, RelE/StbE family [Hormoscilla sp. GM102CHS1]